MAITLVTKVTYGGGEYELRKGDLGPRDDRITRQATGLPITSALDTRAPGLDSISVVVWYARVKSGEPKLRFEQVERELGDYEHIGRMFADGTLVIETVIEEDPDAIGPSNVVDAEVVAGDPLPSAAS